MVEGTPGPRPTRPRYDRYRQSDEFTVGGVVGKTFSVWWRKLLTLLLIMVLIYSPLVVYKGIQVVGEPFSTEVFDFESDEPEFRSDVFWRIVAELVGALLLSFIAQAAVIYAVFQELREERVSVGESLRVALLRLLPVLGVTLAMFIVLGSVPFLLGLLLGLGGAAVLLLALPLGAVWFFYFWCVLWVSVPAAVVERPGVFGALNRSAKLAAGHKWRILAILLILVAIQWGSGFIVGVANLASVEAGLVLELVITVLLGALTATAAAVGYHDLRRAKEGVGVEDLVKVFA